MTNKNKPDAQSHAEVAAVIRRRNIFMLTAVLGLAVLFFVITIVKMSLA
ncbi:MAG: hypothetical protein ISP46_02685 [Alphaproteobacteria bacterium]|jgi:hypothetical protein|nr:hypothetical protein [Alphaproteobacteria bacterium]